METRAKPRMSNIELLRIVAMALIIASHLSYWGGAYFHTEGLDHFIASLFATGGKLGVSLFVMIGSIFMAKKDMSCKAVLKIILITILVDSLMSVVMLVTGKGISIIGILYPLNKSWFVNVYLGLMLVSPWLNKLISVISYKRYRNLCVVLTIFCAIFPTIILNGDFTNQPLWFVYLYLLTNFIIKYKAEIVSIKFWKLPCRVLSKTYLLLALGVYVFLAYMVMCSDRFFPLRNSGSVIMLFVALGLFIFLYHLKIGSSSLINWIAKGTFVAYLIHDNGRFKDFLWGELLKCNLWYNSPHFLIFGFLTIAGILLIGAIVGMVVEKIALYVLNIAAVKKLIDKVDVAYQAE